MKKKWVIIGAVVLVLAIAVLIGIILYVNHMKSQPGVYVFDGDLYVDLEGSAFTFNVKSGEVIGETPVDVNGCTKGGEKFEGTLSVLGYPTTETGKISGDPFVRKLENNFYEIHYSPACLHAESVDVTNEAGEVTGTRTEQVDHFCNYQYIYCVNTDKPNFLAVYVYNMSKDEWYCSVVAENEEQAREGFQWLRDNGI